MNKQILFASGPTHRADGVVLLTPDDRPLLALVARLQKKHTESKQHKTKGRDTWDYYAWRAGLSIQECDQIASFLQTRIPNVHDCGYYNFLNGEAMRISTTHSYRFYAAEVIDALQNLYTQVEGLPSKVDDDQFQPTDGQTLSVKVPNASLRIDYKIPFDHAAWEARHKKNAEVDTTDAEAKKKQAEADQAEADAQRAAQKAKLMKTLRISLVALAIVTVVVVLALIIKKK